MKMDSFDRDGSVYADPPSLVLFTAASLDMKSFFELVYEDIYHFFIVFICF
jgi:hypothetical protein